MVEKHPFNYDDGRTKYGSVLAPTYDGYMINVDYQYVLRIWHKASFGSDSSNEMHFPVNVACPSPHLNLPKAPKRRNSGGMMQNR